MVLINNELWFYDLLQVVPFSWIRESKFPKQLFHEFYI